MACEIRCVKTSSWSVGTSEQGHGTRGDPPTPTQEPAAKPVQFLVSLGVHRIWAQTSPSFPCVPACLGPRTETRYCLTRGTEATLTATCWEETLSYQRGDLAKQRLWADVSPGEAEESVGNTHPFAFLESSPGHPCHWPEAHQNPWDADRASKQVSGCPDSVPTRACSWYLERPARVHTARWLERGGDFHLLSEGPAGGSVLLSKAGCLWFGTQCFFFFIPHRVLSVTHAILKVALGKRHYGLCQALLDPLGDAFPSKHF